MRASLAALCFTLGLAAGPALACEAPVCQVDPDSLALPRLIDFEGLQAGMGPGHRIDEVLNLKGARFGMYFQGQRLEAVAEFDAVSGGAAAPLTLLPGPPGQTKSLVRVKNTTILNGFGPEGFPSRRGQGEGALAIQFDQPQSALSFDIRGGEEGEAIVQFLAPGGALIAEMTLRGIGEGPVGFLRGGGFADIAGIVVTNRDSQGIAIDNLRFGRVPELG